MELVLNSFYSLDGVTSPSKAKEFSLTAYYADKDNRALKRVTRDNATNSLKKTKVRARPGLTDAQWKCAKTYVRTLSRNRRRRKQKVRHSRLTLEDKLIWKQYIDGEPTRDLDRLVLRKRLPELTDAKWLSAKVFVSKCVRPKLVAASLGKCTLLPLEVKVALHQYLGDNLTKVLDRAEIQKRRFHKFYKVAKS